jgi:hypothetical protein
VEELLFRVEDVQPVVDAMAELADGSGWLVLHAAVEDDDLPPPPAFAGLFSAKGPDVPELSWVPGERGRRPQPLAVGIRHGAGPKAKRTLAEQGHAVPDDWFVVQDNPRRGLVANVPDTAAHADVLDWLLKAAAILANAPLSGDWRARIHRR